MLQKVLSETLEVADPEERICHVKPDNMEGSTCYAKQRTQSQIVVENENEDLYDTKGHNISDPALDYPVVVTSNIKDYNRRYLEVMSYLGSANVLLNSYFLVGRNKLFVLPSKEYQTRSSRQFMTMVEKKSRWKKYWTVLRSNSLSLYKNSLEYRLNSILYSKDLSSVTLMRNGCQYCFDTIVLFTNTSNSEVKNEKTSIFIKEMVGSRYKEISIRFSRSGTECYGNHDCTKHQTGRESCEKYTNHICEAKHADSKYPSSYYISNNMISWYFELKRMVKKNNPSDREGVSGGECGLDLMEELGVCLHQSLVYIYYKRRFFRTWNKKWGVVNRSSIVLYQESTSRADLVVDLTRMSHCREFTASEHGGKEIFGFFVGFQDKEAGDEHKIHKLMFGSSSQNGRNEWMTIIKSLINKQL